MTSVKISTTDELLAVLPYQLGYRLEDCLVVAMVTDRVLGPVARSDLPGERQSPVVAQRLVESLLRVSPSLALVVGYESVAGESRSFREDVVQGLVDAGVRILDVVTVREGRWWGGCCRDGRDPFSHGVLIAHLDGHPMPDDCAVPAVAELIASGSAPLASRGALHALVSEDPTLSPGVGEELDRLWAEFCEDVDPDGLWDEGAAGEGSAGGEVSQRLLTRTDGSTTAGHDVEDLQALRSRVAAWLDEVDRVPDLWARVLAPATVRGPALVVDDHELALMLRSLRNKPWRDALIAWMSPVMFPLDIVDDVSSTTLAGACSTGPMRSSEQSQGVLDRLLSLAPRVPDEFGHDVAALCTLAGSVAWGLGNGSMAGDAITRALRGDPGYTLATYLDRMIEHQLRPERSWAEVAA